MPGVRVFSIEDHPLIVEGLKSRFKHPTDILKIVGSASNVEEAVKLADPSSFDLFFLDLMIPDTDPIDNVAKLKKEFPDKIIVILTGESSLYWMEQMSHAGVNGYLLKSADKGTIKNAIERILLGSVVFPDTFSAISYEKKSFIIMHSLQFKPLEKTIVKSLSEGLSQKEIAQKVNKSSSAVEKILRNLRKKIDAKNNEQLVQYFLINKII